jgi:N-methylhydantoinase A
VGSAIGLLSADARIDVSMTRIMKIEASCTEKLKRIFAELAGRARDEHEQLDLSRLPVWNRHAYLRHAGQGFEIKVNLPPGEIDEEYIKVIANAFYAEYEKTYGYRDPDAVIEGVDWQLVATLTKDPIQLPREKTEGINQTNAVVGTRQAYFPETGGFVDCKVVDRYRMRSGEKFEGPAIVEEAESTTIILPGDTVELSQWGNLIVAIGQG